MFSGPGRINIRPMFFSEVALEAERREEATTKRIGPSRCRLAVFRVSGQLHRHFPTCNQPDLAIETNDRLAVVNLQRDRD